MSDFSFDYHYGDEAEQYIFYRIPKLLFTNPILKQLSDSAKLLYGLMLDRMSLSRKNNWLDKNNKVYIFFTHEDTQEHLDCASAKSTRLLSELEKVGLIHRERQGQGRPTKIYVKRFVESNGKTFQNQNSNSELNFDYHYGAEAEQYVFYRIPKSLFSNPTLKQLSDSAKLLYGLMLDRMSLSRKNNWFDGNNKVYIFFTHEDTQEHLDCASAKSTRLLGELDKVGLIHRERQGQGRPTKIYVKRFVESNIKTFQKRKVIILRLVILNLIIYLSIFMMKK